MIWHRNANPQTPSRVVVLGAGGFIGRTLVDYFTLQGTDTLPISSARVDLLSEASVQQLQALLQPADLLIFCSALTPDKGKDIRTLMKNLAMGEHGCAALSKSHCSQVIYVSSDAVYADGGTPIRETTPCHPSSFHGLMHLVRERMLQATLDPLKIPLMCVRPTAVYGAGDTHNSYGPNRFVRAACRGDSIGLFGDGEERRDHFYIEDLARLIGLCAAHSSAGLLNAATGRSISFAALAQLVAARAPKAGITRAPRTSPVTHRHFDVSGLFRAFPEFRLTPLEAGLSSLYEKLTA